MESSGIILKAVYISAKCGIKYSKNAKWSRIFFQKYILQTQSIPFHEGKAASQDFFLTYTWINSCMHQNGLKVFSLEEYFTKLHFTRNTIHPQFPQYCGNSCQNFLPLRVKGLAIRRNNALIPIYSVWVTLQNSFAIRALLYDCIKLDTA